MSTRFQLAFSTVCNGNVTKEMAAKGNFYIKLGRNAKQNPHMNAREGVSDAGVLLHRSTVQHWRIKQGRHSRVTSFLPHHKIISDQSSVCLSYPVTQFLETDEVQVNLWPKALKLNGSESVYRSVPILKNLPRDRQFTKDAEHRQPY